MGHRLNTDTLAPFSIKLKCFNIIFDKVSMLFQISKFKFSIFFIGHKYRKKGNIFYVYFVELGTLIT